MQILDSRSRVLGSGVVMPEHGGLPTDQGPGARKGLATGPQCYSALADAFSA